MERSDCDRDSLDEALDALSAAHRWLGGERLLWRQVRGLLKGHRRPAGDRPLQVLEVGAGSGVPAARLHRRLRRRGFGTRMALGDLHPAIPSLARNRLRSELLAGEMDRFAFLRLDGARLPFADGSFDLAVSSNTLHHLETERAVAFLAELGRVSRIGWVVTDLRRSRVAYAGVRVLAATVWRHREYPRADGPVSIRRAFTPEEARDLLESAGVPGARVTGRVFRFAVTARSSPVGNGGA